MTLNSTDLRQGSEESVATGTAAAGAASFSTAAVTLTCLPSCSVDRMTASSPRAVRTWRMASPIDGAVKVRRRIAQPQICPSVRMRARAWISFCDITVVMGRNRSMIERT